MGADMNRRLLVCIFISSVALIGGSASAQADEAEVPIARNLETQLVLTRDGRLWARIVNVGTTPVAVAVAMEALEIRRERDEEGSSGIVRACTHTCRAPESKLLISPGRGIGLLVDAPADVQRAHAVRVILYIQRVGSDATCSDAMLRVPSRFVKYRRIPVVEVDGTATDALAAVRIKYNSHVWTGLVNTGTTAALGRFQPGGHEFLLLPCDVLAHLGTGAAP